MNLFHLRALAYLSYFDLPDPTWIGCSVKAFAEWLMKQKAYKKDKHLPELSGYIYQQVMIADYVNENKTTGLAAYLFHYREEYLILYRGSESYHGETAAQGWQDWEDNIDMIVNENTLQEQAALNFVNRYKMLHHLTLCGHSKGGKLAIYTSLKVDDAINDHIDMVVGFNAPGILPEMKKQYHSRIQSATYQKKVHLLNNEYDIVSALFYPVVTPTFIKSRIVGDSLENILKAHGLYEYDEDEATFAMVSQQAPFVKEIHFLFDTMLTRLTRKQRRILTLPAFAYFALDTPLETIIRYILSMLQENHKQLDQVRKEQRDGLFHHLSKNIKWNMNTEMQNASACNEILHEYH